VPGSEQLRFGNFDPVEIRKVCCITIDMNPQTVINEYGSNMMMNKYDPLKTFEAKSASYDCSKENFFQVEDMMYKYSSKSLQTILEDKEVVNCVERAISISPVKGSQGAPMMELSSQEDLLKKQSSDIDRELIEEEDGQKSEVADMDISLTKQKETIFVEDS